MELDSEQCYKAILSRDPRFDGRFFTGVTTTGIYCRPICPARAPRRRNVRFFACAAAAEHAGFRPCMRCRPETSPGTPAWFGTSTTVSRALRLISEGYLDNDSVDGLAERLGVGSRHLRRLFNEHLGASPVTVAQSRRTHFARRLIDETDLPMHEIAASAGFSSLRRFNAAVRSTFERSPTELRRGARENHRQGSEQSLTLRLLYRPPYNWAGIVRFLRPRATPGIEAVDRSGYRRSIRIGDSDRILSVHPNRGRNELLLTLTGARSRELITTVERVRRLFDLHADPVRITQALRRDRDLAPSLRARPGLRLPGAWDPFELTVRAILGQQVSVQAATTLTGRLVARFGRFLGPAAERSVTHLFPAAEVLAKADIAGIGLPRSRADAIRRLATAVLNRSVTFDPTPDAESLIDQLRSIPGIGLWTAEYVAMRALGEPDIFPAGDLGLRRALADGADMPTECAVRRRAEAWRPWRTYAAFHLWAQLAGNGTRRS